jgi:hypothetical protein
MAVKSRNKTGIGMTILYLYIVVCFIVNFVKLFTHCDYSMETSWKEEVIHLVGLSTAFGSMITAWL